MPKTISPASVLGALLMAATALPESSVAGPGRWTSSGPEGGEVSGLVASPFTVNKFWAVSRGGVFQTIDGGVTWTEASAGINRQLNGLILASPTAIGRLHVFGSNKVFFSDDGAVSWSDRTPASSLLTGGIVAAERSPTVAGRVYVGLSDGTLLRSDTAGSSWTTTTAIPQTGDFTITAIAANPAVPGEILAATTPTGSTGSPALWRGSSGGASWTSIACPSGCPWETLAFDSIEFAGSGARVWGGTRAGIARSDDDGATWTGTLRSAIVESIAVHPTDPDEVHVAGDSGIVFTTDAGSSWTHITAGLPGNDIPQPARTRTVVYDPADPAVQLVGSASNGVYRRIPSTDTFSRNTDGFNATNIRAVDTTIGDRVHAGIGDSFRGGTFTSFRSTDNAATWSAANSGLAADQFRDLTVDSNDTDVVYAGGRFDPKFDSSGCGGNGNGGIYKSVDGGLTWSTIDSGIPVTSSPCAFSLFGTVRAITVDEFSPLGGTGASQVLYAGGTGRFSGDSTSGFTKDSARIFKSTDAGGTWVASDSGIGGAEEGVNGNALFASAVQIVQDPTDTTGNTLYAATFIGGLDPTDAPTSIDNGVFKSVDGGASWSLSSTGLPHIGGNPAAANQSVLSLAIDPTDPTGGTLYASTNDIANGLLGTVYKTTDGAASWAPAGTGLGGRDVRDLVVDPANGDVYAAVADPSNNGDGGVFVSSDGGSTWNSISTGFPNSAVATKLALDDTGLQLIIQAGTTRGVQMFEVEPDFDIDGATDATESSVPAGTRGATGDGNGDGVPDAQQRDVASPTVGTTQRGLASWITAEVTPIAGACSQLENSFGLGLLQRIPIESRYVMPFNGLHLRIPDCEQAEVTLTYHGRTFDDPTDGIRAYGLDFPNEDRAVWHPLDSIGSENEWTFEASDGSIGDATPDDGVIVIQAGVKRLREVFFVNGMEAE